jgi:stage V sporulation protein B
MTRALSPTLYGEISILIAILSDLIVPAGVIQILLTREIAKLDEKATTSVVKKYSRNMFLIGLAVAILVFLSSYLFARIFNDDRLILPIKIISIGIPFAFLTPVLRSYYQGKERSGVLSAIVVFDPLIKLVIAVMLVSIGFGLFGASFSLIVSPIILSLFIIPLVAKKNGVDKHHLKLTKSFLFIFFTQIFLMLFFYIDLFFVRYYLGAEQAGYYNAASITAKVIAYSTGGLSLVLYPKYSKLSIDADKKKIKSIIAKSLLFIVPVFVGFMLFPKLIITIFYTKTYLVALSPFIILSVGMFVYAIFKLFLDLMWSQKQERFPLFLSVFALVCDILLLKYLIPVYGLSGAALATSVTAVLFLIPTLFQIRKKLF